MIVLRSILGFLAVFSIFVGMPANAQSVGNQLKIVLFHRGPIDNNVNVTFLNKTRAQYGAADLGFSGPGSLTITDQRCAGVPTSAFALAANQLVLAGSSGAANSLPGGATSCQVQMNNGGAVFIVANVSVQCCGYTTNSWLQAVSAFRTSGTAWGDKVCVRPGSYVISYDSSTANDIIRTVAYADGPNGEAQPTNRASAGWVTFQPCDGGMVSWSGTATYSSNATYDVQGIKTSGMNFYLAGSPGTQVGGTFGAVEFRGANTQRMYWFDEDDISSSFNQAAYDAQYAAWQAAGSPPGAYPNGATCTPNCQPNRAYYIQTAAFANNTFLTDAWITSSHIHNSYDGVTWAGLRIHYYGNLFEYQYRDTINGYKDDSDIAFNVITNKSAIGGSHGDYYQESWRNQTGTRTGNRIVGNMFFPGIGDGSPPGQVIYTDTSTITAINGLKVYGNFFQGEHQWMSYFPKCLNCAERWNTIVYGASGLTGNNMQINISGTGGGGSIVDNNIIRTINSGNVSNTLPGGNVLPSTDLNPSCTGSTCYYSIFVNPVRDSTDDPAVIMARWAFLPGGVADPAVNPSGYQAGTGWDTSKSSATYPVVDTDAWTAVFPDGFAYNGHLDPSVR